MLPLAARIARDRALVEARLAAMPQMKSVARAERKRGAAIEAAAAVRMEEFKAARALAIQSALVRGREERRERKMFRRSAHRERARARKAAKSHAPELSSRPVEQPSLKPQKVSTNRFYAARRETLLALGYPTYQDYLCSNLWAKIRKRILALDGWACRTCGDKAEQVHHTSYSKGVLLGNDDKHLHSVCRKCHGLIEFHDGVEDESRRRTPYEMVTETERLMAARAPNRF